MKPGRREAGGGPRIAINTTCAIAGGAITHLRHLLPALVEQLKDERVAVLGDAETFERIAVPDALEKIELPSATSGLLRRIHRENLLVPRLLAEWGADVLFHPANFRIFSTRVPQLILIHNLAPFIDEVIESESFGQRLRLRLLRTLTMSSVDRVARAIFISDWGRNLVLGTAVEDDRRFPVIPFGAEHLSRSRELSVLERFGLEQDGYVLSVSHLYRYKRLERLIQAYVDLGEKVRSWPLLIVGEPFDRDYAERLSRQAARSLAPIVFTGALDSDSIGSLMAHARAFVFTSEAENLPITLLEAMSAGSAVVTNRHCSMPEVCGSAAIYADPSSADQYGEKLAAVLYDDERRSDLRRRSRERAADFTWSGAASRTLDELRSVALESRR
jgi:glycosyltransferase involved in cell wall biosynthesis